MPGGSLALILTLALQTPARVPATPWPDERPITHVVQNLGHDLARVPSATNAVILATGGAGAVASHNVDARVSAWATRSGPTSITAPGNLVGNAVTEGLFALGTYGVGKIAANAPLVHIGGDLIRAQILDGVFTEGLKISVNRTRPTGSPHSFPSGHASSTFATATVFEEHFGWRVGLPAYLVASYVGFSRVRDNQHWLSDVAFGTALGVMAGHAVAGGHRTRALTVSPTPTKGGFAVWVEWRPGERPRGER